MIRAIMVDVDGVLITGRPADGKPWATDLERDLGLNNAALHDEFFIPYWNDIVTGQTGLVAQLQPVLARLAPTVSIEDFLAYWFEQDARLNRTLLEELNLLRESGIKVYLATNQEHLRVGFLLDTLGLGQQADGIYYSAALHSRKPDAAFFEQVARLSGYLPAQLLLLDDTAANVEAAQGLGWNAVLWHEQSNLAAEWAKVLA